MAQCQAASTLHGGAITRHTRSIIARAPVYKFMIMTLLHISITYRILLPPPPPLIRFRSLCVRACLRRRCHTPPFYALRFLPFAALCRTGRRPDLAFIFNRSWQSAKPRTRACRSRFRRSAAPRRRETRACACTSPVLPSLFSLFLFLFFLSFLRFFSFSSLMPSGGRNAPRKFRAFNARARATPFRINSAPGDLFAIWDR